MLLWVPVTVARPLTWSCAARWAARLVTWRRAAARPGTVGTGVAAMGLPGGAADVRLGCRARRA